MTDRIIIPWDAKTERLHLSEDTLAAAGFDEKVKLDTLAAEEVVNAAQAEIVARTHKLEFEHNKPFTEALRYVIDTYPRLFRLSRLEKTRGSGAVVIAEPLP